MARYPFNLQGNNSIQTDTTISVSEETDEKLCKIANQEKAVLLAFIGPYRGLLISPVHVLRSEIGIDDEFGIETAIKDIRTRCPTINKLYLLVNSMGGGMSSSYKVARALRTSFGDITAFVPHIAASGGTLMAVTANTIVMGLMSQLSPLDVQIEYGETSVSVNSFIRSYTRWKKQLATTLPAAISYPDKHLVDELDPIILEEVSSIIATGVNYVEEILRLAGYKEASEIAYKLAFDPGIHSKVIHYELAKRIGLNVVNEIEKVELWDTMRTWLRQYLYSPAGTNFIKYVIPKEDIIGQKKEARKARKEVAHASVKETPQVKSQH
jgi:hypothetical protein